jgi:hypothetical protein
MTSASERDELLPPLPASDVRNCLCLLRHPGPFRDEQDARNSLPASSGIQHLRLHDISASEHHARNRLHLLQHLASTLNLVLRKLCLRTSQLNQVNLVSSSVLSL